MKLLNIASSGYRATLEEQDDTVVWICHALRNAGAPADLLLRGCAVNYVAAGQAPPRLEIGDRLQTQGPDLLGQVRALRAAGAAVFVLQEDLARYGLAPDAVPAELAVVATEALPGLMSGYDQVWHW